MNKLPFSFICFLRHGASSTISSFHIRSLDMLSARKNYLCQVSPGRIPVSSGLFHAYLEESTKSTRQCNELSEGLTGTLHGLEPVQPDISAVSNAFSTAAVSQLDSVYPLPFRVNHGFNGSFFPAPECHTRRRRTCRFGKVGWTFCCCINPVANTAALDLTPRTLQNARIPNNLTKLITLCLVISIAVCRAIPSILCGFQLTESVLKRIIFRNGSQ